MRQVEQYRVLEMEVSGAVIAIFQHGNIREEIRSFQAGKRHLIRFMPMQTGAWQVHAGAEETSFDCVPARPGNHGPVQAGDMRFVYADGTPFLPFGTTCYAWTHQPEKVRQQTLATLKTAPFNKVRMCVFPKHMIYSENEPERFPFEKRPD